MKYDIRKIDDVAFIKIYKETMEIVLCSFGASFYDIKTLDKNNNLDSIILTPKSLKEFYETDAYYGKTIGRYSGRIDKARCVINEKEYVLEKNWNGVNALHGGYKGISFQNFDYEIKEENEYLDVIFTYLEKEDLLPGDVNYEIIYRVYKDSNRIRVIFNATTTEDTICNLTNHVYFNLSGNGKRNCLEHNITFLCDKYTRLNNELITESIDYVNEVMDFRDNHKLGKYIYDESLQNHTALGYDHCWIKENLNKEEIASIEDEVSGRKVTVSTSYPAIVCYTGCYPKPYIFNGNYKIEQYHSICLECQYIPNGINMENVDKAILRKGEKYSEFIEYKFN